METFKYTDSDLGIYAEEGVLSIKTPERTVTIREQPMYNYEEFYSKWMTAIQIAGDEDFSNSYTFNEQFRELINEALLSIGFSFPTEFTPRQMEVLLISSKDSEGNLQPGVLFGFHSTYPKFPASRVQNINYDQRRILGVTLIQLVTFLLQEYSHSMNFMDEIRLKTSRYLLSLLSWLIKGMGKSYQIQTTLTRLEKIDSEMRSTKKN